MHVDEWISDELLDELIAKIVKEFEENCEWKEVGNGKYYFSYHSLVIDALEQHTFELDDFEKNDALSKWLDEKFKCFTETMIETSELKYCFFYGDTFKCNFTKSLHNELLTELVTHYRLKIKETYVCQATGCFRLISERFPPRHEQHLHHISGVNGSKGYLFCYECDKNIFIRNQIWLLPIRHDPKTRGGIGRCVDCDSFLAIDPDPQNCECSIFRHYTTQNALRNIQCQFYYPFQERYWGIDCPLIE